MFAQFLVRAPHAHHQRHAELHFPGGSDDAFGDRVATHDAAEDIHQNPLDRGVLQHQLERFGHFLRRGTAADVEKIRGLGAEQLDGIHGGHRKTCAVDETTDVAVERNVREIELGCFDFGGILLVEIAHGDDFRMPEQGIRIEVEFGIECQHPAVSGHDQRVDLGERCIAFDERTVQPVHELASLYHRCLRHADFSCNVVGLALGQTRHRIDGDFVNLFRRVGGDFLDFHAALRTRHQGHPLRGAVDHHAHVQFLGDVGALFHEQALHQAAFGTGLVGNERHAENLRGIFMHLVERLRHLDAAALAAPSGMDLRLHDPDLSAELARGGIRLAHRKAGDAARRGDPVLA